MPVPFKRWTSTSPFPSRREGQRPLTHLLLRLLILFTLPVLFAPVVQAQAVTVLDVNTEAPRVYEKYELRFSIPQSVQHPFFAYDDSPPPGVTPATGITVEGVITTPSGKTVRQPAFYSVDVQRVQQGGSVYYDVETALQPTGNGRVSSYYFGDGCLRHGEQRGGQL